MKNPPNPVFRASEEILLVGKMAIYESQAEASQGIPQQWRSFLADHPALYKSSSLYGASPCTPDGKIHYLTGVAQESPQNLVAGEALTLEAGEYAVVAAPDPDALRDIWTWLLNSWLATSGRREKNAPEFERYTSISKAGEPVGAVEIWIPLDPLANVGIKGNAQTGS